MSEEPNKALALDVISEKQLKELAFIAQRLDDLAANMLASSDDELTMPERVHLAILCAVLAAQQYDPLAVRIGWREEDIKACVQNTDAIAAEFVRYHQLGVQE